MQFARVSAALLSLAVIGCGDDGGNNNPQPDASVTPQPDATERVCVPVMAGTIEFDTYDPGNSYIQWIGPITGGMLPGGTDQVYALSFYDGIEPTLTGTFDLSSGNQSNYSTCAICLLGFADQTVYFQSAGTITLTQDPYDTRFLKATITGLEMQEVTIDEETYVSTPVAGGSCGTFADHTVDRNTAPSAWTCAAETYDDATNCNCMCGALDPDCYIDPLLPVAGCTTGGDVCFNDACVAPPANDTCQTAIALTIGTPVNGTTAGAGRTYDAGLDEPTCTNFAQRGGDVVYSVDLTAGTAYTVTLSGLGAMHDGSISLVGPGAATLCDADPIATCVAGSDAGDDGENDTFTYTPTTTGTYFVIVDGYGLTEGGPFTLAVTQ